MSEAYTPAEFHEIISDAREVARILLKYAANNSVYIDLGDPDTAPGENAGWVSLNGVDLYFKTDGRLDLKRSRF